MNETPRGPRRSLSAGGAIPERSSPNPNVVARGRELVDRFNASPFGRSLFGTSPVQSPAPAPSGFQASTSNTNNAPPAVSSTSGNTAGSTQANGGSSPGPVPTQRANTARASVPTTKEIFGIKVSVKRDPTKIIERTATVPREARAKMKAEELQKLYTSFIEAKGSGILEIQEVGSSQETIEHTYDTQVMIESLAAYLTLFDMKTLFCFIAKPKTNYFGRTMQEVEGNPRDLFVDYTKISMNDVVVSFATAPRLLLCA